MLTNFIDKLSPLTKVEILRLREKMLSADRRVKEIKDAKGVFYGRGKTKPCCQLKFVSSTQDDRFNHLKCFLWLPIPPNFLRFNKKDGIGRMYIKCDRDFQTVETVTYWTGTSRYAGKLPIPIDIYLDEVSLNKRYQNIDLLFELALKLNLERN